MTDLETHKAAVEALEEHGYTERANDLREYVEKQTKTPKRILSLIRKVMAYTLLIGVPLIGILAFVDTALGGSYLTAIVLSIGLVILYVIIAVIGASFEGMRAWFTEEFEH